SVVLLEREVLWRQRRGVVTASVDGSLSRFHTECWTSELIHRLNATCLTDTSGHSVTKGRHASAEQ
ncbi:hypothetical protein, partial [Staphylococcus haemolyticus]|uniref:hypothetical protein n=1 Tax=Staphylococcus haemolyticus TaxID=1283 RepID=UPI001C930F79